MPRTLVLISLFLLLVGLVSCLAQPPQPAGAQTVQPTPVRQTWSTPTPLPSIQQTAQAANALRDSARSRLSEADELERRSAEIRANVQAQIDSANQGLAEARAAASAQNAVAFGEAIGRADANIQQLKLSNDGQSAIIATLLPDNKALAGQVISLTNALETSNSKLRDAQSVNLALLDAQADQKNASTSGNIATMFVFIVSLAIFVALIVFVLQRRREQVTITSTPSVVIDEDTPIEQDNQDDENSPEGVSHG